MRTEERLLEVLARCGEQATQPPRPRFSNALGCLRAHVYDRRLLEARKWPQTVQKPTRWALAAATGTALGDVIESAARCFGAQTQVVASLDGIHGNLDIEWPDLDAVWDLKWVGDYAWKQAKRAADPKHAAQVNAYAVARKRTRWALIYLPLFALGKGEGIEYLIHEGEADAKKARRDVTERWAAVDAHARAGTLPEREVDETTCRRLRCLHLAECRPKGGNHGE